MRTPEIPTLDQVHAARDRIAGVAIRSPLIRLEVDDLAYPIYLKLENLQPIGSFKLRAAANAVALAPRERMAAGLWTASAGNMAQGVAWEARRLGVPCAVVAPDHAPATKLAAIRRLGARVEPVPFADWWRAFETGTHPGMTGWFVHPVCDDAVIAGNATIALEILEDLPAVGTILVPFGGGGLSCGIAAVIRAQAPHVKVLACEVATAAPLSASFAARQPQTIEHTPSFVDGIGGRSVLPAMWPLASRLLDGSCMVSLEETAAAIRCLAERAHVIAEGAGAVPVAAALGPDKTTPSVRRELENGAAVCVVSGGNIDAPVLATILAGRQP